MSLGTTLRLPLGNSVEVMDVRRLKKERKCENVLQTIKLIGNQLAHRSLTSVFQCCFHT